MRRVLIVSPHFPPVNAPDMHRVRLALPFLRDAGWDPLVMAVAPNLVEGAVLDRLLEATYPPDIRIIRTGGLPAAMTRWAGVGSLWLRCGRQLRLAAESLLAKGSIDLAFFSTTQFGAFPLGPRWRRHFGVPYVLDLQDPWVNDYYARNGKRPPGGKLKYGLAQWHARWHESLALREAGGIVAVSDSYGPMLAERYPWFDAERVRVLPFGASELDVDVARRHPPPQSLIPWDDGRVHLVYAGRVVEGMSRPLAIVFGALRLLRARQPDLAARIRLHFIGTNYAAPPHDRPMVLPHARAAGVDDLVAEHTTRVPYFEALHYLARADGLVAIGSDDPGYSASKIAPYLLAKRPLLALYHRASPAQRMLEGQTGVVSVPFDPAGADSDRIDLVFDRWFSNWGALPAVQLDAATIKCISAENMTHRLARVFDDAAVPQ